MPQLLASSPGSIACVRLASDPGIALQALPIRVSPSKTPLTNADPGNGSTGHSAPFHGRRHLAREHLTLRDNSRRELHVASCRSEVRAVRILFTVKRCALHQFVCSAMQR